MWDLQSGSIERVSDFVGHQRSVRTAAFRPDGSSIFATGARDGKIMLWDTRVNGNVSTITKPDNIIHNSHPFTMPKTPGSGSKKCKIVDRTNSVTGLVFQDDHSLISCGSGDGSIRVWDLRRNYSNYKKDPLPKHSISYCGASSKNGYSNLLLDKSRMKLFASCVDNVIYCFNVSTYNIMPEQKYVGHENGSFYIKSSLSPDSKYLISGSSDYNAYIWNIKYADPIIKLSGHNAEVTCATWCQVGNIKIITCSDDARHKIWRIGKEYLEGSEYLDLGGRAHHIPPVDRTNKSSLKSLDRTPRPLKRKGEDRDVSPPKRRMSANDFENASSSSYCSNVLQYKRRSKRSLIDMMNNSVLPNSEKDETLERQPKRRILDGEYFENLADCPSTSRGFCQLPTIPECSNVIFDEIRDTDFNTPTKSPIKMINSPCLYYYSPNKALSSPTMNLPNYVIDGRAPHLHSISAQKKKGKVDWLTKIRQEKQVGNGKQDICAYKGKEDTNKLPERHKGDKTLLEYFIKKPDSNTPLEDKTNKLHQGTKRKMSESCDSESKPKMLLMENPDNDVSESENFNKSLHQNKSCKTILAFFSMSSNDIENKN